MRTKRNMPHKQTNDMVSIAKQIKKEHKLQGIKLTKTELNELVITKMNEHYDKNLIQEMTNDATTKIGQVHENIVKMTRLHLIKTKRMVVDDRGIEIEQTIFTDFPIDANNY